MQTKDFSVPYKTGSDGHTYCFHVWDDADGVTAVITGPTDVVPLSRVTPVILREYVASVDEGRTRLAEWLADPLILDATIRAAALGQTAAL